MGDMEVKSVGAAAERTELETQASVKGDRKRSRPYAPAVIVATLLTAGVVVAFMASKGRTLLDHMAAETASGSKLAVEDKVVSDGNMVRVEEDQMRSIKLEAVSVRSFQVERIATGKIALNEDFVTPVFSPYMGRVVNLIAKVGDTVRPGWPLLEIDTPDLVQAEAELIAASSSVARARATLDMARRNEDRQHRLYLNKAVALKDWEQAQKDVKSAESELRSAEAALESARDRLRLFGKSNDEIDRIERERSIDRIAKVLSPIGGTVIARKIGPGQYVRPDNSDPLFVIADLSTVWMLANVYESDVPLIKVGQPVQVSVMAYPGEVFEARISYVGAQVDPSTRRVQVRCVVKNRGQKLKPDMFATFRIITNSEVRSPAVPLGAIVRDGDKSSVWVARKRNEFVRRDVTLGLEQGGYAQVVSGLWPGDVVVSEGGLLLSSIGRSK